MPRQNFSWGYVDWDWSQFAQIRRSQATEDLLEHVAKSIHEAAENYPQAADDKQYSHEVQVGKHTTTAVVGTKSVHSILSNRKHNTLVKKLGEFKL